MPFKQLRDFFIFSRKERNGLLVLTVLLVLTLCVDFSLPLFFPGKAYDTSAWKQVAEKFYARPPTGPAKKSFAGVVDPNSVDQETLSAMGVPDRLAANWVKYLQKGGRFRKKEEVRKLYGMTDDLFGKVEGHLLEPVPAEATKKRGEWQAAERTKNHPAYDRQSTDSSRYIRKVRNEPIALLEVNAADSAQLEALPGIGPALASRIIKYRKLLGGYYSVAQLKEVYGMMPELWVKSSPWLCADSTRIEKLEINFGSVAELGRHPYIGFRQARKLVKKRDMTGKFLAREELNAFFTADSLQRLSPYLSLGDVNP